MSETPPEQERPTAWPGGGFGSPDGPQPQAGPRSSGGPWPAPAQPSWGQQPPPQQTPPQWGPAPQQWAGQPAYGPGWQGYAAYAPSTSTFPGSTAVLLLLSLVSVVAVGVIGIPSAVIAALAWRQNGSDPQGARKRTTTGWIVYAVNFGVGILVLIPFYVWALGNR